VTRVSKLFFSKEHDVTIEHERLHRCVHEITS